MAKKSHGYFGEPWLLTIILSLFLGYPLAVIYRLLHGKIISGIISIFIGVLIWWIDFIAILLKKKPSWFLF